MRIGTGNATDLRPEDVAWVVEWQLVVCAPWLPRREEGLALPDPRPDTYGRAWPVRIHAGSCSVSVPVPLRDLEHVIGWCHRVPTCDHLQRPSPAIRGSIMAIRRALRAALRRSDPLRSMGYGRPAPECRVPPAP